MKRDRLHVLKANLRACRKAVRDLREKALTATGALTRSVVGYDKPLPTGIWRPFSRRLYSDNATAEVWLVSPEDGHFMHTFFDVDPISPGGRYLVATRVPFIWRVPYVGDECQVCVIDLESERYLPVYTSRGWGSQLGCNAQWLDEDTVLCNDVFEGRGAGVKIEISTGRVERLEGPIYGLSPDKKYSYSGSIDLINLSQTGYGVPEPLSGTRYPSKGYESSEGVWRTDLATGKRSLILSLEQIRNALPDQEELATGDYFVQNVKVSPSGDRLLIVVFSRRVRGRLGWPVQVVTCRPDGSDVSLALHDRDYRKGGHHPNWLPSGRDIVMNLRPDSRTMRFCVVDPVTREFRVLLPGAKGGGHPSVHQNRLLTDAYVTEGFSDAAGRVPIRLIDLETQSEQEICRVFTKNLTGGRRVDPHPVWTCDGDVVFNGVVDGRRQIYLARIK